MALKSLRFADSGFEFTERAAERERYPDVKVWPDGRRKVSRGYPLHLLPDDLSAMPYPGSSGKMRERVGSIEVLSYSVADRKKEEERRRFGAGAVQTEAAVSY